MKRFHLAFSFLIFAWAFAQKTHTVKQGETPYGISKAYGLSLEDLYQLNPTIKDGVIPIGEQLIISKNSGINPISTKNGQIILLPKQTIYGITKQYNITETELRKLNPDLDNIMKIGYKVNIPVDKINQYNINQQIQKDGKITVKSNTSISTPSENLLYAVQEGDTVFGIINKFNITLDEFNRLNPKLTTGLKTGMVLKVK